MLERVDPTLLVVALGALELAGHILDLVGASEDLRVWATRLFEFQFADPGNDPALRREVESVAPVALARFLPAWHGIGVKAGGTDRLLEVVFQLQGLALPASVIERDVSAARTRATMRSRANRLAASSRAWLESIAACMACVVASSRTAVSSRPYSAATPASPATQSATLQVCPASWNKDRLSMNSALARLAFPCESASCPRLCRTAAIPCLSPCCRNKVRLSSYSDIARPSSP